MSETMYMTSDPKNNTGSSVTSSKINGLEDPAFISTDRDNDNVTTTFEESFSLSVGRTISVPAGTFTMSPSKSTFTYPSGVGSS